MSDHENNQDNENSGNRWEPQTGQAPEAASEQESQPEVLDSAPSAADAPAATAGTSRRPAWLTRSRAVAGGIVAAAFVVGGGAGFALGHATNDGSDGPRQADFGRGFGDGRDGDGPDGGFGRGGQPPSFDGQSGPDNQNGNQSGSTEQSAPGSPS